MDSGYSGGVFDGGKLGEECGHLLLNLGTYHIDGLVVWYYPFKHLQYVMLAITSSGCVGGPYGFQPV